jgi:hypothetical protein
MTIHPTRDEPRRLSAVEWTLIGAGMAFWVVAAAGTTRWAFVVGCILFVGITCRRLWLSEETVADYQGALAVTECRLAVVTEERDEARRQLAEERRVPNCYCAAEPRTSGMPAAYCLGPGLASEQEGFDGIPDA